MTKQLLLVTLLLLAFNVEGKQITESKAMKTASAFVAERVKSTYGMKANAGMPTLKEQIKQDGNTAIYVFKNNAGFVLVAGDDTATPIIGFSDNGDFDYNSLPENAKWWIDRYTAQIAALQSGKAVAVEQIKSAAAVAPLLGETKWNQADPYNRLTPTVNGKKSPTGCVATAMAQIMYSHKWPETGVGSQTYTPEGLSEALTVDFTQSHYQWDKMTPTYNSSSSEEAKDAVAKLMYDCGVGAHMIYGEKESAAMTEQSCMALVDNFNYDKGLRYVRFDCFKYDEWIALMKKELEESRAIMYGGSAKSGGGHQFVCDGYNNEGLFHINWGWGGLSDGYYALTLLDPESQGIGGSTGNYAFTEWTDAVIGIQKPTTNPVVMPYFMINTGAKASVMENTVKYTFDYVGNYGYDDFKGKLYVVVRNVDTGEVLESYDFLETDIDLPIYYGYEYIPVEYQVDPSMPNGRYEIVFKTVDENSVEEYVHLYQGAREPKFIKTDDGVTLESDPISIANVESKLISSGSSFTDMSFAFDATNTSESKYKESIKILLDADFPSSVDITMDLNAGETKRIAFDFQDLNTGETYTLRFVDGNGCDLREPEEFVVPAYRVLDLTSAEVENGATGVDPAKFKLTGVMKNISWEEDYSGAISCKIYQEDGEYKCSSITDGNVNISKDSSADFTITDELELAVGNYYAVICDGSFNAVEPVETNKIAFKVAATGVGSVTSDELVKVEVYSLDGVLRMSETGEQAKNINLQELDKGSYVLKAVYNKKVETKVIINK